MNNDVLKPAQEADQIKAFISGPGPAALFDLPWTPVFLAICFFLHSFVGWLVAGTMVVLVSLALLSSSLTRTGTAEFATAIARRNRLGEAANRNAEAIAAMGMLDQATRRWNAAHGHAGLIQRRTADITNIFSGISRALRQLVQSGTLGCSDDLSFCDSQGTSNQIQH